MNRKEIQVTKTDGVLEAFDPQKLRRSLIKSGADEQDINAIMKRIEAMLFDGISTKQIYKEAFKMLRSYSRPVAARYSLKKGIRDLGPSGYPFETYFGELLRHEGCEVKVGVVLDGHCVQHEVDVIATKNHTYIAVECKFHSDPTRRCDVKVPLYIHSRFEDIQKHRAKNPANEQVQFQGWLATNTRFTNDAREYGVCAGLHLVSWDFPESGNLKDMVTSTRLYPITCLTSITKKEKVKLIEKGVIMCLDLCDKASVLDDLGMSLSRRNKVLAESEGLCSTVIM